MDTPGGAKGLARGRGGLGRILGSDRGGGGSEGAVPEKPWADMGSIRMRDGANVGRTRDSPDCNLPMELDQGL